METIYAATHIEKEVTVDDFEKGEIGRRTTILYEKINITAPTLKELIEKVGKKYALDINHVFVSGDSFSFNQTEDEDGNEADENDKELWKKNEKKLWTADYRFIVEARIVREVTKEEYKALEGITVDV